MINFYTPVLILKNNSHKDVRILEIYTLRAGETVDIYKALDYNIADHTITSALAKPSGDLYVESQIKKSIEIIEINLVTWNYSITGVANLQTTNTGQPGQFLGLDGNGDLSWLNITQLSAAYPLTSNGSSIGINPADSTHDGYLTKEDWSVFNNAATRPTKPSQKIWEYEDFSAPVGSTLTLSVFQNGTGLAFNSSYIIDSTAAIVLTSDTSSPPTTTTSIPGKYLPGNRVTVSSHIGTTVVLNQAPDASLNCRVFFLISLPADQPYPTDYQEDPEFVNPPSLSFDDANYVNQNQDETIYGIKTFNSQAIFSSSIQIPTGALTGYVLTTDNSGNGTWQPSGGVGSGITAAEHEALRQLIHLANNGPFEGFTTGAFRETLPTANPFPTQIIWWESSSKLKKIVDKTITYGANPSIVSTIRYRVYDADGVTVLATVTDNISYSGIFEVNRTRTIA